MKKIITGTLTLMVSIALFSFYQVNPTVPATAKRPKISFTFDDGSVKDMPGYVNAEWNQLILNHLAKHKVKAVLFATGSRLKGEKGKHILSSWNNAGHKIANHTFTHPYFHSKKVSLSKFKGELLRNHAEISQYSNFYPYFRFPYLKEGNTLEKRDGFRKFLKERGYKVGHVSIDASDWYVDKRLVKRLRENPKADISGFKQFYIEHLYNRAQYYDSLAYKLTNRRIRHNVLLHHNLASALFLDDLIQHFKDKGWEVIDAHKAFKDKIYRRRSSNLPAGESIIWAWAKETGKFDDKLRYPAEDGRYEKAEMDKRGL